MEINGQEITWNTLDALLRDKALRHGHAVFAEIAGEKVTYYELDRGSHAVAANLLSRGIQKGDRVATFMSNAAAQLFSWFGAVRAGLIWVPLNAALVGEDLKYALQNSGAAVLIGDEESIGKLRNIRSELGPIAVFSTGGPAVDCEAFSVLTEYSGQLPPLPATLPSDPGAILYTGGTTGLPKGVILPQFSFVLAGLRYRDSFGVRPGERHYSTMPLFHAGAIQWGIMGPLISDMTTVIDRRFSASTYFDRLRETRANVIDAFGVVLSMLCAQPPSSKDQDHCVRISVGAVHGLPPSVPAQFTSRFGIPLLLLYGLTEGGGAMLTTNRDFCGASNGRPHGWVELLIANEDGSPMPVGETGDVLLRPTHANMFMQGYFGDAEKSLQSFRDCWLHTGDLGRVDAEGNFWFVGRKAHWLRRRGESISAVEVETILAKCPGVREAAVVPVPSELGDDDVKAFIVNEEGTDSDPARISEWCVSQMAAFKIPRFIEFIKVLPRSTTKMEIDRAALRRLPNETAFDRERSRVAPKR